MDNPYTNAIRFLLTECLRKGDSRAVEAAERHLEALNDFDKRQAAPADMSDRTG